MVFFKFTLNGLAAWMHILRVLHLMRHPYFFYREIYGLKCKSCSFFGHREIEESEGLEERLFEVIESLINNGVTTFLFGSRSEFDALCHSVVTKLREKYPEVTRVAYDTKSECSTLEENRAELEKSYSEFLKREVSLLGYEQVIKPDKVWKTGKASYVERNQAMINDSDYCVVYYNENYTPKQRLVSDKSVSGIWTSNKSGTFLAYKYALQKKKEIINVFM